MYLEKGRAQKTKSEQLDKKKSRTSQKLHSVKSNVFSDSNMTINYSRVTSTKHNFVPHVYSGKRSYKWTGREDIVERAISEAIKHLDNASCNASMKLDIQVMKSDCNSYKYCL